MLLNVHQLLEQVGLPDKADSPPDGAIWRQQQRVQSLARWPWIRNPLAG